MTFSLNVIFILAIVYIHSAESACPPFKPVNECTCGTTTDSEGDEFSFVTCKNLRFEEDLKTVIQSTIGYKISELEILDSDFRYIPHDAFIGTAFEILKITDSTIHSLSDSEIAFEGLENHLHLLEIINCSYSASWEWSQLTNLINMKQINIGESRIFHINQGISRIQHIDVEHFALQKNNIDQLNDRAFAPFQTLKSLTLDNNYINKIERTMFPKPAKYLKLLAMNYNNLQVLPEDLFDAMPGLRSVQLTGNPLRTIDENVFGPVIEQLNLLLFHETNLACDCRIGWLARVTTTRKIYAECFEPLDFRGRVISSIKEDELLCVASNL